MTRRYFNLACRLAAAASARCRRRLALTRFTGAWTLSLLLVFVGGRTADAQLVLDENAHLGGDETWIIVWAGSVFAGEIEAFSGSGSYSAAEGGAVARAAANKSFSSGGGFVNLSARLTSTQADDASLMAGSIYWVGTTLPVTVRVVESHNASQLFGGSVANSFELNLVPGQYSVFGHIGTGFKTVSGAGGSEWFDYSLLFSVNDLPGETKGNPQPWEDEDDYPIAEPAPITGFNLTGFAQFPVVDDTGGNSFDYGRDNYVYVGASSAPLVAASAELESEGAGGASYLFAVGADSPNFSHFTIPDPLPGGDDTFLLEFEGFSEPYTAGTEFDFTALVPGGVSLFSLSGVDGVDPGQDLPGVQGFRFVDEGVAQVFIATVPIPEPSTLALALLGAAGLVCCRRRRRGGAAA